MHEGKEHEGYPVNGVLCIYLFDKIVEMRQIVIAAALTAPPVKNRRKRELEMC
jgi:hypothetical protein